MSGPSYSRLVLDLLRQHGLVLVLAIIVGALCVAPHVYARYTVPTYAGIHLIGSDAEEHYDARIQEVRDGFPTVGNTFLPDKTVPPVMPALGENIMAFLGDIFHVSTPALSEYAKFVFPFFATIFAYAFGYLLLRSRAAALLGATTVLLGDNLISGTSAWSALLHGSSVISSFLTYSRPINPELSGVLLFIALLLSVRAFFSERTPQWYEGIAIGAIAGAAFYMSPYVASFILGLVAIVGAVSIYQRDWKRTVGALATGVTALTCLTPFILNYSVVVASPLYADTAARVGAAPSYAPVLGAWAVILLVAAIFAIPKRFHHAKSFFLYSAIALILLLNQQVLSGHVLQTDHYHWYITKPLIAFLIGMYAVFILGWIFHKRTYLAYAGYAFGIGILIINAIEVQAVSYKAHEAGFIQVQRYAPIMQYLSTVPQREFIWADYTLSEYVPMYTHHDTANNRQIANYLVPTDYLEQQLFIQYRLRGVSDKDAPELMRQERAHVSSVVYAIRWRQLFGGYENIPEPILVDIEKKYLDLSKDSTTDLMRNVGVTMVIWDKQIDPKWHMESLPNKTELFSDKDIVVYRIGTSTRMVEN
jgi:hypothetical protein